MASHTDGPLLVKLKTAARHLYAHRMSGRRTTATVREFLRDDDRLVETLVDAAEDWANSNEEAE